MAAGRGSRVGCSIYGGFDLSKVYVVVNAWDTILYAVYDENHKAQADRMAKNVGGIVDEYPLNLDPDDWRKAYEEQ